jgi:hypothetical protein
MTEPNSTSTADGAANATVRPRIRLEPQDFRCDEGPDRRPPEVFDLKGLDRHLFYGPYIELAPGVWRARVELELSEDASKRQLAIQFGIEPDFTVFEVPYRAEGRMEFELEYAVRNAGLVQIRLWLRRAAFTGKVRFGGVTLERVGDTSG